MASGTLAALKAIRRELGDPKIIEQQEEEDAARIVEIARRGYRVIRFWNNDVMQNLAGVLEVIRRELECPLCPSGGEGGDPSLQRRGG